MRLPLIGRALRLSWQAAPRITLGWLVLLAAAGLLPAATVTVTRRLVDALAEGLGPGSDLAEAGFWIAVMAALLILTQLLSSAAALLRARLAVTVEDHVADQIHQAAIRLDLKHFESPEFHDRLYRARTEAGRRPMELLESCGALLQNTITLAAMTAILLQFGAWTPLLLIVATLPGAAVVTRAYIREHQWRLRVTPEERRAWYYDWLLTAAEPAAEMRLYELGPHFRGAYNDVRSELRRDQLKFAREQNVAELLSGVFALAVVAGALLIMAGGARERSISLGQLAMFFHAFQQGLGLGRTLLSSAQRIFTGSLFLEYLIELLELEPDIASPAEPRGWPASPAVSFRNVSFRYPGARREALRSLDLDIPAGSIVALLGPNGAGKSTFAKLLTRLYDPDDGRIEIGGVDIRDLSLDELRRRVGILPQSPVRFNETARENVALGKVHARLEPDAIEQAVRAAGAEEFLANLPKGLDNILGRWFQDGAELSGGEWQRVATARALVRDAQILVLDEPTSNMDPWSEAEWTVRLREHLRGRTVVLITHRLTTARHADWIVVMERGSVIEQGSHGDLQAQSSGSYSKAWLS